MLGRSRLLLNLHREGSLAFEWVRALDAISSGCVVLTEPSSDLEPLVPGEHVLVASPARLGTVARAALTDPDALDAIAGAAYDVCTTELDVVASGRRLVDIAGDLLARTRPLEHPAPFPQRPRPDAARRRHAATDGDLGAVRALVARRARARRTSNSPRSYEPPPG